MLVQVFIIDGLSVWRVFCFVCGNPLFLGEGVEVGWCQDLLEIQATMDIKLRTSPYSLVKMVKDTEF